MSTVTMSIYEALEKKKILEDKVMRVKSHRLCCVRKANEEVDQNGKALEEVKEQSIRPGYQESVALIKNLIALKAAINEANSRITIEVDGKTYTIANAIVQYRNIDKLQELYQRMLGNYQSVQDEVNKLNTRLQSNESINAYLEKALGDGTKRDPEMVKKLTEDYIARNSYSVYDPLKTEELAREELERLEKFKNEMHFKLTQANISNEITVEYDD